MNIFDLSAEELRLLAIHRAASPKFKATMQAYLDHCGANPDAARTEKELVELFATMLKVQPTA